MLGNAKIETAAFLAIGNELLVGRTQEKNLQSLARFLNPRGINIVEARLILDRQTEIRKAARTLSRRADFLFTSGGIGPTHDDITSAAIAAEFGCPLEISESHLEQLSAFHKTRGESMNEARLKMVRLPRGAEAIDNPVSIAPGFRIENVYVLAGVPQVFKAMLDSLADKIVGGVARLSETIHTSLYESEFAEQLALLQQEYPESEIGSYPRLQGDKTDKKSTISVKKTVATNWKNAIVVSDTEQKRLSELVQKLHIMLKKSKV